jgi:hypothetical protein
MAHVNAALAGIWILQDLPARGKTIVTVLFAEIFAAVGGPRCASTLRQFGDDSRDRFRAWAIVNLPPDSKIGADYYAGLLPQENFYHLPVTKQIGNGLTVTIVQNGPNLGPIALLRLQGYSYIAVADAAYERFFIPEATANPNSIDWFNARVQWYRDLFAKYPMVYHRVPDFNLHAFTDPEIRVYEIDGLAKTPSTRQ